LRLPGYADILLISDLFPPRTGGSGRWLWELHRRLADVRVHVAAGAAPDSESFDQASAVPIVRLPLSFSNWGVSSPRAAFQYGRATRLVARLIREIRPGVVHCGKCLPEGFIASLLQRRYGIPFVCFVHGEELTLAATSRELSWLTGRVLRDAAHVIANSAHSKKIVRDTWGLADRKVTVMHPGVDTSRFIPSPPDVEVRQRLDWLDRRVILTVGALQKRKGQDMMIRALPAIRARVPDVLYSIVGEGWERPYLDALAADLDVSESVQFRGVPGDAELVACYQQCDVFALPNRQVGWDLEGFGMVLLEAQACGKPVITGDSGGTSEAMTHGETGVVVSCETVEPIVDAVCGILETPERGAQMGRRGRDRAVTQFDWQVLGHQADALFARPDARAAGH
jgi:phosphatidylinositol alpha-1,6-mannosyltransferase